MTAQPGDASSAAAELVRTTIREQGSISFARFMEFALYDDRFGYYAGASSPLGPGGDYFTASDAGREFGACLARQLVEIDATLGPWSPFEVVELGAGRGLLARDILDTLRATEPSLADRMRYAVVDRSAAMRERAGLVVPEARCLSPARSSGRGRGVALAVELFDALPVHRVRRRDGRVMELRVGCDEAGRLVEAEREASDDLCQAVATDELLESEGSEAEICLAASEELARMAGTLEQGVLIVVDYGHEAHALACREAGTLLAYHRHQSHTDYLSRVGEQDLTAHVNWTALKRHAIALGLDVLGLVTQDRFLISNGILECFQAQRGGPDAAVDSVKRRMQAMTLIHPDGMGRSFSVLLLGKNLDSRPALRGLEDPFAR